MNEPKTEMWITPDFEDLSVSMEATAYSGAEEEETVLR
jgi:coenzyme PQQ precursor peptide PqqA